MIERHCVIISFNSKIEKKNKFILDIFSQFSFNSIQKKAIIIIKSVSAITKDREDNKPQQQKIELKMNRKKK